MNLTDTERQHLDDLIRRGARHLTPAEQDRLHRLWGQHQTDHTAAQRTTGGLMARVQQLGGRLKTADADRATCEDEVGRLRRRVAELNVCAGQAEARIAAVSSLAAHWSSLPTHSGAAHQLRITLGEIPADGYVLITVVPGGHRPDNVDLEPAAPTCSHCAPRPA